MHLHGDGGDFVSSKNIKRYFCTFMIVQMNRHLHEMAGFFLIYRMINKNEEKVLPIFY